MMHAVDMIGRRRWGAFILVSALLLLTITAARPVAAQEPGKQASANAPKVEPVHRVRSSGPNWWVYGAVGFLVAVLLGILYLMLRGREDDEPKKRRSKSKVTVGENQVDGYRMLNLMMTGQTSQVWEVSEVSSGRHFALKMLLPENVHKPIHRNFLFHEAEVGRQIVHPKIIKMLAVIKDWDHPYVIMEFFPSTNLKLRLMHKDPFIQERLRDILEQTAIAIAYMHEKGWVHRDVKPDNILVNASAEVRLIDFALAQRLSRKKPSRFRRRGKAQGTRSYMSPEQIRGEPLDARADLYSFGITIYELTTGRPPFRGNSPGDLLAKQLGEKPTPPTVYNPEITREMSDMVMSMLSKDREGRPRDFHDFLMKFRGIRVYKGAVLKKKE
jgi:serine/threonine-protein kinase